MARTPEQDKVGGGLNITGPVAEVWRYGVPAGTLWNWRFNGWDREFTIEAERYSLKANLFRNGKRQVEVRLLLRRPGQDNALELRAEGSIWTQYQADGHSHRAMVIKGGHTRWKKPGAMPLPPRQPSG